MQQLYQRHLLPPCSSTPFYLSPNGRTFRTMQEVQIYNRQLEKQNVEGDHKEVENEKKMLILKTTNMEVSNDGNSSHVSCNSCSEIFINDAMLKKHRKKHLQEQLNQLQCNQCEQTFASQIEMALHEKKVHIETGHHKLGTKPMICMSNPPFLIPKTELQEVSC